MFFYGKLKVSYLTWLWANDFNAIIRVYHQASFWFYKLGGCLLSYHNKWIKILYWIYASDFKSISSDSSLIVPILTAAKIHHEHSTHEGQRLVNQISDNKISITHVYTIWELSSYCNILHHLQYNNNITIKPYTNTM